MHPHSRKHLHTHTTPYLNIEVKFTTRYIENILALIDCIDIYFFFRKKKQKQKTKDRETEKLFTKGRKEITREKDRLCTKEKHQIRKHIYLNYDFI